MIESMNLYEYESDAIKNGHKFILGIDEVGRGPIAGPLVVAGCILPLYENIEGLTDSKKLSEKKLQYFYDIIKKKAVAYCVKFIEIEEIDRLNIYQATKKAMEDIVKEIDCQVDYVLSDAMKLDIDKPYSPIIKGDQLSLSIAAASVLAKVERDNYMKKLALEYPCFEWEKNKGYPTKKHLEALKQYGVTNLHRTSYRPVADEIKIDNIFVNKGEKI